MGSSDIGFHPPDKERARHGQPGLFNAPANIRFSRKIQHNIDFFKPHKHEHDRFIGQCTDFYQRAEAGEHVTPTALAFVKPWVTKHIRGEDMDYAAFVRRYIESGAAPVVPWPLRTLNRFFPKREK